MSSIVQNKEVIECVFGEDKQKSIIKLRELIKESSELHAFEVDDIQLLQFLYFTSFDVNIAVEKIKAFKNNLIKHPTWFAAKPPLEVQNMIEKNIICLLDARDKAGRALFVLKLVKMDLKLSIDVNAAIFELIVDHGFMQAETCENGVSIIFDLQDLPWKMLTWATPRNIKIIIELINSYPCKDIKIHVVKTTFILDAAIKIIWPLLPANIKEMIKFHFNNWPSLHEYINPENLPSDYGGTGSDIDFTFFNKKLYEQNEKIKERLRYRRCLWKD